jgi:hypothetical protein
VRLNKRELLFEEAKRIHANTTERLLSVRRVTIWCAMIAKSHHAKPGKTDSCRNVATSLFTTTIIKSNGPTWFGHGLRCGETVDLVGAIDSPAAGYIA